MSVAAYQGTVVSGEIRLPASVRLPENAVVYVMIPGLDLASADGEDVALPDRPRLVSPRLVHRDQATEFVLTVVPDGENAGLR